MVQIQWEGGNGESENEDRGSVEHILCRALLSEGMYLKCAWAGDGDRSGLSWKGRELGPEKTVPTEIKW